MFFTRITVDPKQMDGVPCIRGLRIPVATVVDMVADGMTEKEILQAYPDLEREDIPEALRAERPISAALAATAGTPPLRYAWDELMTFIDTSQKCLAQVPTAIG